MDTGSTNKTFVNNKEAESVLLKNGDKIMIGNTILKFEHLDAEDIKYHKEIQKKIILLGDGAVGKTSLIRRFVVDKFEDKYILTIGSKITAKTILIEKSEKTFKMNFQIWDILGQKGYEKLHKSTFRGTDGVLLVTDITRRTTLTSLENYWIPEIHTLVGHIPIVILANKSDLLGNSAFDEDDLRQIAFKFNAPYFFTSAKFGDNARRYRWLNRF